MTVRAPSTSVVVLFAASVLTMVLGSVHAFSVFLDPIETKFSVSRSTASLTYSIALISLTAAVLLGPGLYPRFSAKAYVAGVSVLAAAGACLAAFSGSVALLWLGYGVIFGAANGLGYGFALQIAAQYSAGRQGLFMGIVTAAYALGAFLASLAFERLTDALGFSAAMLGLASAVLILGGLSALFLARTGARFVMVQPESATGRPFSTSIQALLWLGFFTGVFPGLAIIGRAAGILAVNAPEAALWLAPGVVAACSLLGSLVSGRLADRLEPSVLALALPLVSMGALLLLLNLTQTFAALSLLGAVGFAYGGIITVYPALVAKTVGADSSAKFYGRVFTAWGSAGLLGPWIAGWVFDLSGGYQTALLLAAVASLLSCLLALFIKRRLALP